MDAMQLMRKLNANAVCAEEDRKLIFIEDVVVDTSCFRLEYRCNPDGTGAVAMLLYNPYGANPYSYEKSHIRTDGLICVGPDLDPDNSRFGLVFTVTRARLWCFAFAYLVENGYDAVCEVIPEWRGR